jgi:thiosulfate/3-mercaptopyruvate sulfurtransferase
MTRTDNGFRHPEYLVETDWLEQHLDDPDLRVFDCTVIASMKTDMEVGKDFPFAFESGRARYGEGHVPGADHLDLLGDLSDTSSRLPFTMPSEKQFSDAMGKAGVGDGARVVLYGTAEPIWAARVWWMLRAFGFDHVAILNGGWAKWSAEGRPVSKASPCYPRTKFVARPRAGAFVGKDDVMAAIGDSRVCTINALPAMIFEGSGGPVFGRKGRIAGSLNVPFPALHDPDTGAYLPAAQLRAKFDAVHADKADRIIAYCGSGIAASSDAFALALLGFDNVAVYDASLSEWGFDETLPIEAG